MKLLQAHEAGRRTENARRGKQYRTSARTRRAYCPLRQARQRVPNCRSGSGRHWTGRQLLPGQHARGIGGDRVHLRWEKSTFTGQASPFRLSLCAESFRNIFDCMLTCAWALIRLTSAVQCGIIILEEISHRGNATQAKAAESIGTITPYVCVSVNGGDKVVNKTFNSMTVGVGWRRMI